MATRRKRVDAATIDAARVEADEYAAEVAAGAPSKRPVVTVVRRDAAPGDVIDLAAWAETYVDLVYELLLEDQAARDGAPDIPAARPARPALPKAG